MIRADMPAELSLVLLAKLTQSERNGALVVKVTLETVDGAPSLEGEVRFVPEALDGLPTAALVDALRTHLLAELRELIGETLRKGGRA